MDQNALRALRPASRTRLATRFATRWAAALGTICLAVVLAGCGGGKAGGDAASATTVAPPTASSAPVTTKAATTSSEPVLLADGRHPVYITAVDAEGRRITVDVIQFLTGEAANKAAAEDHQESPPPNDYYIRNVNPKLRTLPVRAGALVTVNTLTAEETGSATRNVTVSLAKLASLLSKDTRPPIWITVKDGQVTRIAEQFVP